MLPYVTELRRKLHQHPEIGFDLTETLAIVKKELDDIGVSYTDKYGKSSIVATINEEKTNFTIAIRADMDALPIQEENDVPYKSLNEGKMHACGHDAHTAIAVATLKELYAMRNKINCKVKFLFQAAEEVTGGGRLMVEDGVLDDVDCVVGLHQNTSIDTGKVRLIPGPVNANSTSINIVFKGRTCHAASQHKGVDAIMMGVKAYTAFEFLFAKEFDTKHRVLFNVGVFSGGVTKNVVAAECRMSCTLRTHDDEDKEKAIRRIKAIVNAVAEESGGSAEIDLPSDYPILVNNPTVTERMWAACDKVLGEENVDKTTNYRSMGGEDFAFMAKKIPACFLKLGIRNAEKGITPTNHNCKFDIDEDALELGVKIFKQFVLDNMDGIPNLNGEKE